MSAQPTFTRPLLEISIAQRWLAPLAAGLAVGMSLTTGLAQSRKSSMPPAPPITATQPSESGSAQAPVTTVTTSNIAARLVPLSVKERPQVLKSFPGGRGENSQLADSFEGSWYVHKGDLTIDGDFESNLNLVVEGDLTVRGTIRDGGDGAGLVVMGDVRARNVLIRQLMVVLGSLHCPGLVHADYNDFAFEVWGPLIQARALVLTDKSTLFLGKREVEYEWNDSTSDPGKGRAEETFIESLVRWMDEEGDLYRREANGEAIRWVDENDEELDKAAVKALKGLKAVPAEFEAMTAASISGELLRPSKINAPLDWRLDGKASPELVAAHSKSTDAKVRKASAAHPQLPGSEADRLAGDSDAAVRKIVAIHPRLSANAAGKLAADGDAEVRRLLASSPHAAAHLDSLVRDDTASVRRATASHPALSDAQRRILLGDTEAPVRGRTLRYLPVTVAWVKELRDAKAEDLAAWAIQNEDKVAAEPGTIPPASSSNWQKDLLDERQAVREAALGKVQSSAFLPFMVENQARFVNDKSDRLRCALAGATRDAAILTTLSKDHDPHVRRIALDNLAVPAALLVAEANRLAQAPKSSWNTSDAAYLEHSGSVHDLLKHPRLPAEAVRTLAKVYPRTWRMEPHPNMPLDIVLDRALSDSPSLEFAPGFVAWQRLASDPKADPGPAFAAMLEDDTSDLQAVARLNSRTPLPQLLKHARTLCEQQDRYSLEEVARNPQLKSEAPEAEALRQVLLTFEDGHLVGDLAGNPDLPLPMLKKIALLAPDKAATTLWQVWGEVLVREK